MDHDLEILKKRADALSAELPSDEKADILECILFELGNEIYAIEAQYIREARPLKGLNPLPFTPAFVKGVMSIRRKIISVIDLRILLGIPYTELSPPSKVIILENNEIEFAILIDALIGIVAIDPKILTSTLSTLSGLSKTLLKGITPERYSLIDGEKLINSKELIVQETVE